ncbi:AAA family ATPase [Lentzea sp. NPDC058450]|uniref:helix-turn-helix transcriptional regulator n=1 Tax=Lentzea sp. NPDC058450 TaxID=3346505 RepID=UPI003667513A
MKLQGRHDQCAALAELLDLARAGTSRALVVAGEIGSGKTALLNFVADAATGFQVVRAEGVESETGMPFAGLHQLCRGLLGGLGRLPEPQRTALNVAFGFEKGDRPRHLLIGMALSALVTDAASRTPVLCVVDDAQWLDRETVQALGFVTRRLSGERIAVVVGTRDEGRHGDLEDLPELPLPPLSDEDARALLASVLPGRLDERVRGRVVAEAAGNPLALREFGRNASSLEFAGGFGVPQAMENRIRQSFLQRTEKLAAPARRLLLSEAVQRLLLLAAAETVGDPALLSRAAGVAGIADDVVEAAESAGLLRIGTTVAFCHPLARSAVYQGASVAERRAAHRALASAVDRAREPDRWAWHLAQAASFPNEEIAAALEDSAQRAQIRGGMAAAAAFLARSAVLTPDPGRRAHRALSAACAATVVGGVEQASRLVALAEAEPVNEEIAARIDLVRARIAFLARRDQHVADRLVSAAQRLRSFDPVLARDTYRQAFSVATHAGSLAAEGGLREVALAVRTAPAPAEPQAADLLTDGFALSVTEDHAAGASLIDRALVGITEAGAVSDTELCWLTMATPAAQMRWDADGWDRVSARHVRVSRTVGALTTLSTALSQRAVLSMVRGDVRAASDVIEDALAVPRGAGDRFAYDVQIALNALRGNESACDELFRRSDGDLARQGRIVEPIFVHWAAAVLYNGFGRYEDALARARPAAEFLDEPVYSVWTCAELVEAAIRCGRRSSVPAALARLSESTRASGTDWALGIEKSARALTLEGDAAETLYREAVDHLGDAGMRFPLARTQLLYGEWLRRNHRRRDAREQLQAARDHFAGIEAAGFAERATRELRAAGDRTQNRSGTLTEQEHQIAVLAGAGLSNPDIAAQLYISRRTVEYHLGKIFAKLAIPSRAQLGEALAAIGPSPEPQPSR